MKSTLFLPPTIFASLIYVFTLKRLKLHLTVYLTLPSKKNFLKGVKTRLANYFQSKQQTNYLIWLKEKHPYDR